MKKPEEYLGNIEYIFYEEYPEMTGAAIDKYKVIEIIKQAQIDAIEETAKLCAENVELKEQDDYGFSTIRYKEMIIDKQSILNCAEILKKEIE